MRHQHPSIDLSPTWVRAILVIALVVGTAQQGHAQTSTANDSSVVNHGSQGSGTEENTASAPNWSWSGERAQAPQQRILVGPATAPVELIQERTSAARSKYPSLVMSKGIVYKLDGERSAVRLAEDSSIVLRVETLSSPDADTSTANTEQVPDDLLLVRLQPATDARTLVVVEQTCYGYRDVRRPGGSIPFQRAAGAPGQWELRMDGLQPGEYALVAPDQIVDPAGPIAVHTFGVGVPDPPVPAHHPSHGASTPTCTP